MHHQGAGGQYFRCHSSWTSRIRLLGSAEQSKLQRTLCKKTWHIANNCIDHFDWAEQHKRKDHDTDIENEKKHYLTLRRTISHFSPFYRWIVTWGASAILTPRQHNTTKKWNCPARLEFFEPTTNYDHHINEKGLSPTSSVVVWWLSLEGPKLASWDLIMAGSPLPGFVSLTWHWFDIKYLIHKKGPVKMLSFKEGWHRGEGGTQRRSQEWESNQ